MKLNRFTEHYTKFVYERSKIEPVSFLEASQALKPCLVCMPGKLEMIKPAAEILPELAAALPNRSLKIMLSSSIDPQSHEFIKKFFIIRTEPGDYDTFSLPKKHFIEKVAYGGVGIAIDLDLRPNPFNAVLALRTGAKVRTSFDKDVGLPYYNMIVGPREPEKDPRASYRVMADVIGNFRF
jgi:hypothetical protein